ncbi:hypothetical protein EJ110_NYTH43498 [Nymphaea thermarum]|nr:hypothetical protein EJ110_NYTH43498 [Nymphaea thermarum]
MDRGSAKAMKEPLATSPPIKNKDSPPIKTKGKEKLALLLSYTTLTRSNDIKCIFVFIDLELDQASSSPWKTYYTNSD